MLSAAGIDDVALPTPALRSRPRISPWAVWAFSLGIVFTYFATLGHFPLAEPDEPRYAEIAREMLELRDWITPHLNYVKYFEKPPLVYWLTAINLELFGMSELVVRLWPALFALLGILMAYALGRSMYGIWTGYVAAAVLATAPFYFALSQVMVLDMPLATLMTLGIGSFWLAHQHPRRRWPFVLLLYIASALAVLTKGPVAVLLTGGIIGTFLLVQGELAALRWVFWPLGVVLFLLITVPWFLAVSERNPEFLNFFIFKQHVSRFLTPDEHQQPLWFFVPLVLAGMLPWSGFVLVAPRITGRFLVRLAQRRASPAALFCVAWSTVVFVFFSVSGSKLGTYILPMFCPLAILAARFFRQVIEAQRAEVFVRMCVGLLVLAGAATLGATIAGTLTDQRVIGPIVPRIYIGALTLVGVGSIALVYARRNALQASFVTLLFGMLAVQFIAITGRGIAAQYRPLGWAILQQAAPQDRIVLYEHYTQAIAFYARRRVVVLGGRGELDFGSRQDDQREFFWETDAQLLDVWRSAARVFLIINRSELETLRPQLRPAPRQIAAHGKKVVVVNFD